MRRTDPGKADNARGAGKRVGGGVHAPPLPGDTDPLELFERTKAYVGWTEEDSRFLHSIYDQVEPHIDRIVDDFYERILRDPGARRAITEGEPQIARLKQSQRDWLTSLLRGPHDGDFALAQSRIGRVHVKVGLDQIYMVTGAQVFREHLCRLICASQPAPDAGCLAILEAVDKGLTIVLTLMLESYREDHLRKFLEGEKSATNRRLAALGEVAASLAHEIRNPLAGISGAIQVLAQDLSGLDGRQEILREIRREIGRLDERVNDLLVYSRPSTPRRETTLPSTVLETTRLLVAEDPQSAGIRLHFGNVDHLPAFPLDPGHIQQVLVNLVLNAFQVLGGKGGVWVEAAGLGNGSLQFTVEDDGPGIDPQKVETIFRPFFTTRRQGTGLGLSISRRLIEAHGGSLEAGRGSRGGARFLVHLPLPAPEDARSA
jgi:signal transduction histidine kinase